MSWWQVLLVFLGIPVAVFALICAAVLLGAPPVASVDEGPVGDAPAAPAEPAASGPQIDVDGPADGAAQPDDGAPG